MIKHQPMSGSRVVKYASIALRYVVTSILAPLLVLLIAALES